MEREKQNSTNLDNIIFYSGQYAIDAAEYTVDRAFGTSLGNLGTLSKNDEGLIYWSNYPNVLYKERDTIINNIGDLYKETLSYITSTDLDYSNVGNTYIANNRYNVIYTYETDLNNDFDNAKWLASDHLVDFLTGLNRQTFNKGLYYGDSYEVSSIKIDQTYFNWYPANTVAYVNTIDASYTVSYHEFFVNEISNNQFEYDHDNPPEDVITYLDTRGGLAEGEYLHATTHSYLVTYTYDVPYTIGNNYYSYVKHIYNPIDDTISNKINEKLEDFEERYNHNTDIYAYYIYDCKCDLDLILSTKSVGVKQSKYKIGFDSKFSNWFGNTINLNINLNEDTNLGGIKYNEGNVNNPEEFEEKYKLLDITSAGNNEIFSVFKNKSERISGENVEISATQTHSFYSNVELSEEDEVNILTPYEIDTLDLSALELALGKTLNLNESNWTSRDCKLRALILDNGNPIIKSNVERIYGINDLVSLEYLDISNHDKLKVTPAIDALSNLKVFKAKGSSIESFRPFHNLTLNYVSLPETVKSIKLIGNHFEEGILNIKGEDRYFNGLFEYTPNSTLSSLSLRRVDDELSYRLVKDWYDVLKEENKLDSVIYLELDGINWKSVPVETLIGIKRFDINPSFSGNISILGSGNYNQLSRSDYQSITKLYGINAFVEGNKDNKVFNNLNIIPQISSKETFEFSLKVLNTNIKTKNQEYDDYESTLSADEYAAYVRENRRPIHYIDTLNVEFNQYEYNFVTKDYTNIGDPYTNRAANSILDMIYSGKTSFTFRKDDIDKYIYCNLDTSIDTSSSNAIKKVNKGDILLFNGDTLMIYFENQPENSIYEYVKIGNILDQKSVGNFHDEYSTIENWFNDLDEVTLEFIPSQREVVIQKYTVISNSDILYENNHDGIEIKVDIDEYAKEHYDEIANKEVIIDYNSNLLNITDISETEGYPKKYNIKYVEGIDFTNPIETYIKIYSPVEENYTKLNYKITLKDFFYETDVEEDTLGVDSSLYEVENGTLIVPNDSVYVPEENMIIIK